MQSLLPMRTSVRPRLSLFLLILAATASLSRGLAQQSSYCTFTGGLFYSAEENPHFKGSLHDYFRKKLKKHFPATDCTITLKLWIDTTGKACCLNIERPAANAPDVDTTQILNSIAEMPGWTPALQNHHRVNCVALIQLSFYKSRLNVIYKNEAPVYPPGFTPRHHA
jgi:hypothetical protein